MANIGGGFAGAASGASLGSAFGPVGTAIGAIGGGILGLFGKKKKKRKVSRFDPQQQQLYNQQMQALQGQGPLSNLYNYDAEGANQNFDLNVGRPAYRNYQENIIPQITGQYRQNNLMNSSYSGEALARSGRNVQENLDAQRSNMQFLGQQNAQTAKQNAINNMLGGRTHDFEQNQPSQIDQILQSVGPAAGDWLATYLRSKTGR